MDGVNKQMRLFLLRKKQVLCQNLTHYLYLMVEVEVQIVILVHFGLVQLMVEVGFLVEGIMGQRFLVQDGVQFKLQLLVVVEQALVEVQSQVGIDVQVFEYCFSLLIVVQKVRFQGVWLEWVWHLQG